MLSQTSLANKLKEHLIFPTTMEVITFNPNTLCRANIIRGWRPYEDFSYGSQNFQSQGGSSYNYQEQIHQPFDEELYYALLNDIKKDHTAWEAKMKDQATNEEAPVTNLENPIGQLAHALEGQHLRPLPSNIKDEDKREHNFVPLSFKEEIQEPTLVEEIQIEIANEEELLVENRQVEEQHPHTTIENVLVGMTSSISP